MNMPAPLASTALDALPDEALADRARRGDRDAFSAIMQRCNQRLFRVARGIVDSDFEAEDVVQEAYVLAYAALPRFRGDAQVSTWLTRIVVNEARGRLRKRRSTIDLAQLEVEQSQAGARVVPFPNRSGDGDPAADASRAEVRRLLEQAIAKLPPAFRVVFVMREIEGCDVEETATSLGLRPETVKTRLHRARRLLRGALAETLSGAVGDAFPFLGARCARIVAAVLARLE